MIRAGFVLKTHISRPYFVPLPMSLSLQTNGAYKGKMSRMLSSISPVAGPATSNNQQHGDLNNTGAVRPITFLAVDPGCARRSLAIAPEDDDPIVREKYRPYILEERYAESDWVMDLELSTVLKMAEADLQQTRERLKVLVLFGSLRRR